MFLQDLLTSPDKLAVPPFGMQETLDFSAWTLQSREQLQARGVSTAGLNATDTASAEMMHQDRGHSMRHVCTHVPVAHVEQQIIQWSRGQQLRGGDQLNRNTIRARLKELGLQQKKLRDPYKQGNATAVMHWLFPSLESLRHMLVSKSWMENDA